MSFPDTEEITHFRIPSGFSLRELDTAVAVVDSWNGDKIAAFGDPCSVSEFDVEVITSVAKYDLNVSVTPYSCASTNTVDGLVDLSYCRK